MDRWIDVQVYGMVDGWMMDDERLNRGMMDRQMDGGTDARSDGWMGRWQYGMMDG